jgi:hypothetical protein
MDESKLCGHANFFCIFVLPLICYIFVDVIFWEFGLLRIFGNLICYEFSVQIFRNYGTNLVLGRQNLAWLLSTITYGCYHNTTPTHPEPFLTF